MCPRCGSLERHRLLVHFLQRVLSSGERRKVLHFAPETCLQRFFSYEARWDYLSADLYQPAMAKEDITKLSFPEGSFDLIVCSHVLDHVPADIQAMRELRRVLRPHGIALILSMIDPNLPETQHEAPPNAPTRSIGNVSMRLYGRDFSDRLRQAGFQVEAIDETATLDDATRIRFGVAPKANPKLREQNTIYACRKV